jgi:hypothetical protein
MKVEIDAPTEFQGSVVGQVNQRRGVILETVAGRTITTDGKPFTPITDPEEAGLILSFLEPGGLINFGDWRLKGSATGTATWFRWHWKWEDDLGDSSFYPRIDGDIGTTSSLSALRLTSTGITASTDRQIEQFAMVLPMEGV